MLIVGLIATQQEAHEIEYIAKVFIVAERFKQLALEVKNEKHSS